MVSVIIPNYNHASFLEQRINSVLNQTYSNIEVIILDDASTDTSFQIIDQFRYENRVTHIVYNKTNTGSPFIQWKKGIDLAEGEYIWMAESDDYADPSFLKEVMNMMESNKEIVICYTDSNVVEGEKINEKKRPSLYYNKLFKTDRWSNEFENEGNSELKNYMGGFCTIINASSCVFLKSAYPSNNPDICRYKYCGDWLTWIEMCTKGTIGYINEPLNYFRIHANSTINKFSNIGKAKEFYQCLLKARSLTKNKNYIPKETLDIVFYLWTYDSLYFFLKNFKINLFIMHTKLDKTIGVRVFELFKKYYKRRLSNQ